MKRTVSSRQALGGLHRSRSCVSKPYLYWSTSIFLTCSIVSWTAAISNLFALHSAARCRCVPNGRAARLGPRGRKCAMSRLRRRRADADADRAAARCQAANPIASSTWLAPTLPEEHAAPALTATPARSSLITSSLSRLAGQRDARGVGDAQACAPSTTASGVIARHLPSSRSRKHALRCYSARSARAISAAAPKPAIAGDVLGAGAPAALLAAALDKRRRLRSVANDERADALRDRRSCGRTGSAYRRRALRNRRRRAQRLAPHRYARETMRHARTLLPRRPAALRRSRCWPCIATRARWLR